MVLKKDNKVRDDFIQKLRRTSRDFAGEVDVIEQNCVNKLIQKNASLQGK